MKTNITLILGLTVGLVSGALAQDADTPAADEIGRASCRERV